MINIKSVWLLTFNFKTYKHLCNSDTHAYYFKTRFFVVNTCTQRVRRCGSLTIINHITLNVLLSVKNIWSNNAVTYIVLLLRFSDFKPRNISAFSELFSKFLSCLFFQLFKCYFLFSLKCYFLLHLYDLFNQYFLTLQEPWYA